MKKMVFLVLLFLLGTVNAVEMTGDFSLEVTCSSPASATYVLRNDSGRTETYTIGAVGENSDWINMNGEWIGTEPLVVTLSNGSSKELTAFIKPQTCYVVPGTYTLKIQVSNSETIEKEIEVEVEETRTVEVSFADAEKSVSQCGKAEYEIRLRNTGKQNESIGLEVEGIPKEWVKLSFTEVFLEKGKTKAVALEIEPECDAIAKEYAFKVRASMKGTSHFVEETASFEIEDRQEIGIYSGHLQACADRQTSKKVKISNKGLLEDSVVLSVEGLGWVDVKEKKLGLLPGESRDVEIIIEKGQNVGNYQFELRACSEKFGKETKTGISFELLDCYNIEVESVAVSGQEAGKIPKVCLEERPVYSLSLVNNALEQVEAEARVLGLDASVSPGRIILEKGQAKTLEIELDLSGEKEGRKVFTLQVNGKNFSLERDFELEAEDCYNLQVGWDGLEKEIELDANCKSSPFTITVDNRGTREQTFSVESEGPNWVYFEPEASKVAPSEQKEVYLYFSPPYDTKEGEHTAIITVNGKEGKDYRRIEMAVFGGLYADLGTASVKAEAEVEEIVETVEKTVKVFLQLSNDSNSSLRVMGIFPRDENTSVEFTETLLLPEETIEVPMQVFLGQGNEETSFLLGLEIETDKGTMERTVEIDLESGEEQSLPVGLQSLAGLGDWLLAAIVIVVIAIFATVALRSEIQARKPESGLKHLADEVQDLPGKKLEEIGGRKKARKQSKNLHEIVKEVKKKQPSKPKKTSKKPARKRK